MTILKASSCRYRRFPIRRASRLALRLRRRMRAFAGKPMRLLVQAVGPRVSHHYDRAWTAAEGRQGRLVVIGLRGLDRDGVVRTLLG